MSPNIRLFRPFIHRLIPQSWILICILFLIHAYIRFGGLNNPLFIPLSMIIIWPLPWILSPKEARKAMGFNISFSWWYVKGPLAALGVLFISAGAAWWVFGETNSNWFAMHAYTLGNTISNMPENTTIMTRFLIVTIPAMIFSPLGEEFLFRGYMQTGLSGRLGKPAAMIIQAAAFAFVHLAHYGLQPFQPDLLLIWLPSMFLAALTFGWIVIKSKSVWCAVISHSIYNLGMNAIVFIVLSDKI